MFPRVCVLGETLEQAIWLLDVLCEANPDNIYRRRRDVGIMNDGTELIPMSITDTNRMMIGRQFDYVFYANDQLPLYCAFYGSAMEYLEQRCLAHSAVPREFQWCSVQVDI